MTTLTDEQTQALLNYLGTQPYVEVAGLIQVIAQAQQVSQNGTPEKEKQASEKP